MNRVYVCSCFGITEQQVKKHAEDGACTPRQIASASKAGTDCGSCVRQIQALLGRGSCPRRQLADQGMPVLAEVRGAVEAAQHEAVLQETALHDTAGREAA
ncbi:bacterioferritin-associated ferredoxin [Streptomyces sp. NPDC060011]|uniref:(2Fe-2S)-binding protein n=1 Tax=unclassified Streptomyces TaxID=2593676 RepID=UPI0009BDA28A|nr:MULTISPECIES: (2Fe-2S)-binding protein [unclassified Streptomyces]MCX5133662.1 (2Fe-2S)-binding protein [Streptomyces sp. NBC_00340]WSD80170.1 (2Fe-2S)-binding protein [Streptomyces sp. NBC_01558]WSK63737.1 (2Fe-2S)-binding protein [Streptomyces sp. NBC_01281]